MQESVPVGAAEARPLEPTSDASRAPADGSLSDPRALQILSTEHWSLLASRSLAYNEAFSRAGMFLSFLSATLIVIGFLIGTQGLSAEVVPVATILLLADLVDRAHDDRPAHRGQRRGTPLRAGHESHPTRLS